MKRFVVALLFLSYAACPAWAETRSANFPYVQSMQMGVFYARCVPEKAEGTGGTTKIYRVRKDQDELVDSYDWYARNGVVLAWSPIAGKVAVMALRGEADDETELSFYLGGKFLNSYTSQDLKDWGADVWHRGGRGAVFKVIGEEQIPGTNEYVFSIEVKERRLSFDILTGKPYSKPKDAVPAAESLDDRPASPRHALTAAWKKVQRLDHALLAKATETEPSFDEDAEGLRSAQVLFTQNAVWKPKAAGPVATDPRKPHLWVQASLWRRDVPSQPPPSTSGLRVNGIDYSLLILVTGSDADLEQRIEAILAAAFQEWTGQ